MEQLLRMEDIYKSFSEVRVLNKIKLELRQGKVHALLGENGVGRSTLIKILDGAYTRGGGEIYANEQKADITNVESAKKYGARIIHQKPMLIFHMTITKDTFLGQGPRTGLGTVNMDKMNSEIAKSLVEMELLLGPAGLAGKLNIVQQQTIEIIKAISFEAKIIAMDESTSSLTDTEVEILFKVVRKLKENGAGIIYISHRMLKLDTITGRITVIRDEEYMDTTVMKGTDYDKLVSLIVGRSPGDPYEEHYRTMDEVVLKIEHPLLGREVRDVALDLHKGEVLGFPGLIGSGCSRAMKCIFSLRRKEKGKVYVSGKGVKINSVRDAMGYGIGLVPEDRKKERTCAIQGIRFNITIEALREFLKNGRYDQNRELTLTEGYVDDVIQTKHAGTEQLTRRLNGGNQQKVIISRWFLAIKNILILDEPTRGIDVKIKSNIHRLADRLATQDLSIISISPEMPGLTNMYDRIVVMN